MSSVLVQALVLLLFAAAVSAQTLSGRVVDPQNRPVADAEVLAAHGEEVTGRATTGRDGRFGPIDLPPGDYEVTVAAPGLGTSPRHVTIAGSAAQQIELALTVDAVQESVIVSANETETTLTRSAESVTVIDRAELETTQTASVADALRLVPGFSIAASGGPGGETSIFPRGGESDYTLVLIDGVRQNGFGGEFDAAHLDAAGLERVEVVSGPNSALYGSDAVSGVVQLISRMGGPPQADAAFEGGGYGFWRSAASASGSQGAWRWGGSYSRLKSDGDTRVFPSIGKPVANDDYDRVTAAGSLGWSDRTDRSIRVDVRGGRAQRGEPGPYGSDPLGLYGGLDLISREDIRSTSVGASAVFGDPTPGRHRLQFTWFNEKGDFTSPFGPSDDETHRITGRYQFDRDWHAVGMSAGWEILRERVDNTFITGETYQPVPITRLVSGLFVEARPSLGDRVLLTAGARLERIARDELESSPGSRPAFTQDVVWSTNPKVSVAWFARPADEAGWTKIRASAGTGIKPPTGFEIAYTDNPSLKPERSRSVDAGVEQSLPGTALVLEGAWFFNQYDDLIVTVGSSYAGASRYHSDNIANAESKGVELAARWRSSVGLALRAGYSFTSTEVLGIDGFLSVAQAPYHVGDALIRRPRHVGFGELTWTHDRANMFLTIGGRGEMSDLEPNYASSLVTNPGYATVSFGGAFTLAPHVEVFARVTNALDRSYEEVYGFPALGRSASVGVRVAAGR